MGAPLGSHPPLGKAAPQLGAPLQVGRQRWTCGARWLSPSHQLTESMLQTGAGCRTAPPLCAGGAAKKKEAPQLGAPVGLPRRPPGPPGRKAEQPPGRGRAPRRGTACTICVRREESYLPYWPALVFGRGSKKRGLASWEPPSHCPALVGGRGSKKKGAPWPPSLWLAPEATWASGANGGATCCAQMLTFLKWASLSCWCRRTSSAAVHCSPVLVCGRGCKNKKEAPMLTQLGTPWLAPEATWASGAKGSAQP